MNDRISGTDSQLKFEVAESYAEMSRQAGKIIIAALKRRPTLLLCASAGGTPTGAYACLAAACERQPSLFRRMHVLQIDEWGGLEANAPATCAADLRRKLTAPLRLSARQFVGFRTEAKDPGAECERISRWLTIHGPIDVCVLGIGLNGHIAMNEPGEALRPQAHVAELAKSSLEHSLLRDLADKPKFGLTLGMWEILCARQILLLASGAAKRAVLRRLREPKITTQFPASFLWLHPNATVLCDREAAETKGTKAT